MTKRKKGGHWHSAPVHEEHSPARCSSVIASLATARGHGRLSKHISERTGFYTRWPSHVLHNVITDSLGGSRFSSASKLAFARPKN